MICWICTFGDGGRVIGKYKIAKMKKLVEKGLTNESGYGKIKKLSVIRSKPKGKTR